MKNDYFKYNCFSLNEVIFYRINCYSVVVIETLLNDNFWIVGDQFNITDLDKIQRISKVTDVNEIKRLDKKRLLMGL